MNTKQIIKNIQDFIPTCVNKSGDGEFSAYMQYLGLGTMIKNKDKTLYHDSLGKSLDEVFKNGEGSFLLPTTIYNIHKNPQGAWSKIFPLSPKYKLCDADKESFYFDARNGTLAPLLDALSNFDGKVLYVGDSNWCNAFGAFVQTPTPFMNVKDADRIIERVITLEPDIICISAGLYAPWLTYKLFNGKNIVLNIGSILDPLNGRYTRSYQEKKKYDSIARFSKR